jgi:hypothetical protein
MKIGIMLRPYGAQRKLDEVGHALDNISSKTTRIVFFIVKIRNLFEIFIYIHHNLEVIEFISAALFVIPHLDQPLKGFESEH